MGLSKEEVKAAKKARLAELDAANKANHDALLEEGKEKVAAIASQIEEAKVQLETLKGQLKEVSGEEKIALSEEINNLKIAINRLKRDKKDYKNTYLEKAANALDYDSLDYLALSKGARFVYRMKHFGRYFAIKWRKRGQKIAGVFAEIGCKIADYFKMLYKGLAHGSWKTRVSYLIMGFGSCVRKPSQWLRGLLFFAVEVVFVVYMILAGGYYLSMLGSLGYVAQVCELDDELGVWSCSYNDNSFFIMLYGIITIFFIVAFLFTWSINIKQNIINDEYEAAQKRINGTKDDVKAMVDQSFYKTLLALPLLGIVVFMVIPIVFMILIAFTSFDESHQPPVNLFGWVGFGNFSSLFNFGSSFSYTFGQVLLWTLVWAFFATFTNYFLGMLVAMLINKKGIQFKKVWRTLLVCTIAIPQFISLLYVAKIFDSDGILNGFLMDIGWITSSNRIEFLSDAATDTMARVMVILINIWVGIPYLMLITSGVLMNIPTDLYESAKIDGASAWQQYSKITLPYMLFVTGPYLLTSFVGNINNFNVIYFLTNGSPKGGVNWYKGAGKTSLLITWLYSLTVDEHNYNLASVIGILVFVVIALLSLIVYNIIPSTRNEEDFA